MRTFKISVNKWFNEALITVSYNGIPESIMLLSTAIAGGHLITF